TRPVAVLRSVQPQDAETGSGHGDQERDRPRSERAACRGIAALRARPGGPQPSAECPRDLGLCVLGSARRVHPDHRGARGLLVGLPDPDALLDDRPARAAPPLVQADRGRRPGPDRHPGHLLPLAVQAAGRLIVTKLEVGYLVWGIFVLCIAIPECLAYFGK